MSVKKRLSAVQERAICLLVQGNSDRKTAEAINVCRETVTRWRNENPYFAAELNRQRKGIWAGAEDKLRSLVSKATDTLESAIDQGDVKAAVAVLKATGIYGQVGQPTGSVDPEIVLWQEAMTWAEAELQRRGPSDDPAIDQLISVQLRAHLARKRMEKLRQVHL